MPTFDDKLEDWKDVADDFVGASLLLGNGASRSIWDSFEYASLLEATRSNIYKRLKPEDYSLFKKLKTENFEQVLGTLQSAVLACEALGLNPEPFEKPYARIRDALGEAVTRVHVPWDKLGEDRLKLLNTILAQYDFVFTTNYDLLVYWAIMQEPSDFRDYFWGQGFDLTDTEIWGKVTKVVYLHGALHLYRAQSGEVWKAKKENFGADLLLKFPNAFGPGVEPLLISEASSADKLRSIYGSDYLSFAYSQFTNHKGALVIFGQGLSNNDQHLIDAINSWPDQELAVSITGGKPARIKARKGELASLFPDADITFFKAGSHPLGDPKLHVEQA